MTESGRAIEPPKRAWRAVLRHGQVTLRPLRYRDARAWRSVRLRNAEWLRPWEPTSEVNWQARHSTMSFVRMHRDARIAAAERRMMPFALLHGSVFVGQVNLGPIQWGPVRSADLGYWVDRHRAGQGIAPTAVALAVSHAFECGLHRVHAAISPHNAASIRVAEKLGMRREARYERYLDIDGAWRDHLGFALTCDDDLGPLQALLA